MLTCQHSSTDAMQSLCRSFYKSNLSSNSKIKDLTPKPVGHKYNFRRARSLPLSKVERSVFVTALYPDVWRCGTTTHNQSSYSSCSSYRIACCIVFSNRLVFIRIFCNLANLSFSIFQILYVKLPIMCFNKLLLLKNVID